MALRQVVLDVFGDFEQSGARNVGGDGWRADVEGVEVEDILVGVGLIADEQASDGLVAVIPGAQEFPDPWTERNEVVVLEQRPPQVNALAWLQDFPAMS